MKKLVLLLAVAFSVSMFSCGGGEAGAACDSDSCKNDTVAPAPEQKEEAPATEEAPADTAAQDTAAQKA